MKDERLKKGRGEAACAKALWQKQSSLLVCPPPPQKASSRSWSSEQSDVGAGVREAPGSVPSTTEKRERKRESYALSVRLSADSQRPWREEQGKFTACGCRLWLLSFFIFFHSFLTSVLRLEDFLKSPRHSQDFSTNKTVKVVQAVPTPCIPPALGRWGN